MKKLIPYIIGLALAPAGYYGGNTVYEWWNREPEPPTATAQKVLVLMQDTESWRLGRKGECIVDEKSDLVVNSNGTVTLWNNGEAPLKTITADDQRHIAKAYPGCRAKIEQALVTRKVKTSSSEERYKPASEEANKLIAHMKALKGWRLGKTHSCIVNEEADLIVYESGWVTCWKYAGEKVGSAFNEVDKHWISQEFPDVRKKLAVSKLTKAE